MYKEIPSAQFRRSLKRIKKHIHYDEQALMRVIQLLKEGVRLDPRYRDHELKGESAGIRECHVRNDFLLLYQKREDVLILLLVDIGTHASLFDK